MEHDIRIIALDLDGTLLDSAKRLSEANRAALADAAAKGVLIVPTTGRFFGMMPECIRDLPFVRYAITVNGAQVFDRATDAALVREEIPLGDAIVDLVESAARIDDDGNLSVGNQITVRRQIPYGKGFYRKVCHYSLLAISYKNSSELTALASPS